MRSTLLVRPLVLLASSAMLLLSGCLEARVHDCVRYDRQEDRFDYLQILVHIGTDKGAELDQLAEATASDDARGRLIVFPAVRIFDTHQAIIRVDAHHFRTVDLGAEPAKDLSETSVDLSALAVTPGKYFLSPQKTLCYYQQVSVSGKVLDTVLNEVNSAICLEVANLVNEDLKQRANGAPMTTWEELHEELAQRFAEPDAANAQPAPEPQPASQEHQPKASPLEAASLQALLDAATAGKIKLTRKQSTFSISFPLAPNDRREAKSLLEQIKEAGLVELQKRQSSPSLIAALETLRVENLETGLSFSIDLGDALYPSQAQFHEKPDPKSAGKQQFAVTAMQAKNVEIDSELSIDVILEKFAAAHQK